MLKITIHTLDRKMAVAALEELAISLTLGEHPHIIGDEYRDGALVATIEYSDQLEDQ